MRRGAEPGVFRCTVSSSSSWLLHRTNGLGDKVAKVKRQEKCFFVSRLRLLLLLRLLWWATESRDQSRLNKRESGVE